MGDSIVQKFRAIADELEQHPERWTQRAMARNADGEPLTVSCLRPSLPENETPVCWCALGILERESIYNKDHLYKALVRITGSSVSIAYYNDTLGRRPEDIVTMFRTAADIAEVEEWKRVSQ